MSEYMDRNELMHNVAAEQQTIQVFVSSKTADTNASGPTPGHRLHVSTRTLHAFCVELKLKRVGVHPVPRERRPPMQDNLRTA